MIDRSLESLEPTFRGKLERVLNICRADLGLDIRVAETKRSLEDQKVAVMTGASSNLVGYHQFGLAADCDIYSAGVLQTDDRLGGYLKFGFVAMAFGLRWGGNWDKDKNIAEKGEFDFRHVEDIVPGGLERLKQEAGLTA